MRIGVWQEPDVAAGTLGGAAVRALVRPQLFVAQPDGSWLPSLVAPKSERLAPDRRSASFRFRRGASWSDGSPITADDLRRVPEPNVVAVDGPAPDGRITVRFNQPLPGWHRLWSVTSSVTPPRADLWGGPFVVAGHTRGLEAVLHRNDRWYGAGPYLDEVRLVLVPDAITARQLLQRGELDVVMPPASTVRAEQLRALPGVSVATSDRTGWWVGLRTNAEKLSAEARRRLFRFVDRDVFVSTLLFEEAAVLNGFAGDDDTTWAAVPRAGPQSESVDLVGASEEPMTPVLAKAMQRGAQALGADLALRSAHIDQVEQWVASGMYDAVLVTNLDGPEVCWSCRWADVDAALAAAADGGDRRAARRLEARVRDEGLLLPLWRPTAVVAWRDGVGGVRVNGYATSAAWNAQEWWREE